MSKVYKALGYSLFSKYINRALGLASVVLIARMLSPEELGVFAIAGTITLITGELKSFGAGNFLIRQATIDKSTVRRALGLSMLLAWSAGFALILSSWALGTYYNKVGLTELIQVLALGFFLSPFIGIGKALMSRDFEFKNIFYSETSSQIAQLASVFLFIRLDYSYMSLAYSAFIGLVVEFTIVCICKPNRFSLVPLFRELNVIAKFGVYVTLSNLFQKISVNVPDLVIGKSGTSAEVAFFSRGLGFLSFLTMTINSGIQPVIGPYFANKHRTTDQLNASYLIASTLMSAMTVPALAVAGYASGPVINLFFGDQWAPSAVLVSILCYWSILRFFTTLSPLLLITTGHEKVLFYKELVILSVTALIVYFLYPYGLNMIAKGMVGAGFLDLAVTILILRIFVRISVKSQLLNLVPNIFLSIICVGWTWCLDMLIDFDNRTSLFCITILGPTTMVVWLMSLYLIKHPFRLELNRLIRKLQKK